MKHGDFQFMVATELHRALEKTVDEMAHLKVPYYIHVLIDDDYRGPAAANVVRHADKPVQEVTTEGKRIVHTRLVTFTCPMEIVRDIRACGPTCPACMGRTKEGRPMCAIGTPQLGTILFRMDNKAGQLEVVYTLPPDTPNAAEDSDNYGSVSRLVAESGEKLGTPLVFN